MKNIILFTAICSLIGCTTNETKKEVTFPITTGKTNPVVNEKKVIEEPKLEVQKDGPIQVAQKFFDYGAQGDVEGLKSVSYWNHPEEMDKKEIGAHYIQEVVLNFEKDPRMKPTYQKIKKKYLTLETPVEHLFNDERAVVMLSPKDLFVYLGKFDGEWMVLSWNDGFYDGPIQDQNEVIQVYKNLIKEAVEKNPNTEFSRKFLAYMPT